MCPRNCWSGACLTIWGLCSYPVSQIEIAEQRRALHGDSLGYHNLLQRLTDEAQGLGEVIDVLCLRFSEPFIFVPCDRFIDNLRK